MTDATAIPINLYENERELMVVAPMPGAHPNRLHSRRADTSDLYRRLARELPAWQLTRKFGPTWH